MRRWAGWQGLAQVVTQGVRDSMLHIPLMARPLLSQRHGRAMARALGKLWEAAEATSEDRSCLPVSLAALSAALMGPLGRTSQPTREVGGGWGVGVWSDAPDGGRP